MKQQSTTAFLAQHPKSKKVSKNTTKAHVWWGQQRWDVMWDEFLLTKSPDGSLAYPTVWVFIKTKYKSDIDRRMAFQVIGPPPIQNPVEKERKHLSLKYLGDWQRLRADSFNYSDSKLERLKQVVENKMDALEAGRSVAYLSQEIISNGLRAVKQIDDMFEGQVVIPGAKVEDNAARAKLYFSLMAKAESRLYTAMESYLECHGVGKDNLSMLAQMAMVSAAATTGAVVGQMKSKDNDTMRTLMETVMGKSKTFNMPLPEVIDVESTAVIPVKKKVN